MKTRPRKPARPRPTKLQVEAADGELPDQVFEHVLSELSGGYVYFHSQDADCLNGTVEFENEAEWLRIQLTEPNTPRQLAMELRRVSRLYAELANDVCRRIVEEQDPWVQRLASGDFARVD